MFDVSTTNYEIHLTITYTCKQTDMLTLAHPHIHTRTHTHSHLCTHNQIINPFLSLFVDISQREKRIYTVFIRRSRSQIKTLQANHINVNIHFMLKWFILRDMEGLCFSGARLLKECNLERKQNLK